MFDNLGPALETTLVVGLGATAGSVAGAMIWDMVPPLQIIPGWLAVAVGAGVVGGGARSIREAIMSKTYTFSVNANTGLAVGALVALMSYSNLQVPVLSAVVPDPVAHGLVAGAVGGWFV